MTVTPSGRGFFVNAFVLYYLRLFNHYALEELKDYIFEWKLAHTTAAGTMMVERLGIQESPQESL